MLHECFGTYPQWWCSIDNGASYYRVKRRPDQVGDAEFLAAAIPRQKKLALTLGYAGELSRTAADFAGLRVDSCRTCMRSGFRDDELLEDSAEYDSGDPIPGDDREAPATVGLNGDAVSSRLHAQEVVDRNLDRSLLRESNDPVRGDDKRPAIEPDHRGNVDACPSS
jgi:hypothetical protein